jgi:hypothetical protein
MDIVIDDGLHTLEANTSFLEGSLGELRPGGTYVIEDILRQTIERWHKQLEEKYTKSFPGHEFAFIELPNSSNDSNNNMLIIRRSS